MEDELTVTYPKELAFSLKMQNKEFVKEMKSLTIVKLYEIGKISSSLAAKILNLNRIDFLDLINKYNVSVFDNYTPNDIIEDLQNA